MALEFTSVGSVVLAVTNASAAVDLSQASKFVIADKSGNVPVDNGFTRRPNVVRMTYVPTAGLNLCHIRTGNATTPPTAVTTDPVIIASWPLQRILREFETQIAAITENAADTGNLIIEYGFGDPV